MTVTENMRKDAIALCLMAAARERNIPEHHDGVPQMNRYDFGSVCCAAGVDCFARDGAATLAREALWSTERLPTGEGDWEAAAEKLRAGWTPEAE